MNFKRTVSILAATFAVLASPAALAQQPDAKQILEGARMSATLAKLDDGLSGTINKNGAKTPVVLFLKEKNIQFQFQENKGEWRGFHLRMGDENFDLMEVIDGKTVVFPPAKIIQPIAGTDLTYEDLAMRFFFWPNPKLEGEEEVAGNPCYKLRIDKPKGSPGRYEVVYVWVHKKFGAFMRVRGHDKSGGLVKEFQVEDVMQISDNLWTLRKMQVATCDPATSKRISITDVTFEKPGAKKAGPKGAR